MNKRKQLIENYEGVEAFWKEVNKRKELPETAGLSLPTILLTKTQVRLARLNYHEAVSVLKSAIEAVDKGSIKKIDKLVNEKIDRNVSVIHTDKG